ncbi:MAG: ABC transporter ATP-binding protein/permease [Clostridia bacterium]|nr:ABC transporter ATP-binding protein/permease [Clostridia bacterium]
MPGPRDANKKVGPKPKNAIGTIKRILKYLKKYSFLLVIVVICIALSAVSNIATSYMIKPIVDDYVVPFIGQESVDFSGLIKMIEIYIGIVIAGGLAAYIYNIIMVKVSSGLLLDVRRDLFEKLEKLPIKYYDSHNHGEIMSRFTNDIDALREMISRSVPEFISTCITVVGIFIMMILLSWRLTLIISVMLVLMITVIKTLGGKSAKYFREQQKNVGVANGYIEEMMAGSKVVKVFCHEEKANNTFDEINEKLRESATNAHIFASILRPIMANLSNISYVVMSTVGAILVIEEKLEIGALGAFLKYVKQFTMPLTNLSEQFNSILMAVAGAERIFEVIDEQAEKDDGYVKLVNVEKNNEGQLIEKDMYTGMWAWKHPHKKDGSITYSELKGHVVFENVTFGYNSDKMVLKDLSLEAKPGQKIAFVGSTGAGKTTITNLINRFYDINKGKIRYDGININKIKKDDLRKSLSVVLQDTHLFTGTVKDNIKFGKLNATDEEVVEAAKLANAHQFIMHLPDGYDTILSGDGSNLSQGQRQLIAIARAAIANPPILILDEATSSIDTRTEKLIEKGMDNLMKGRTVFVIAHRLSTVRNSDNIMVLEHGEIIESGNHEELMSKKGKYFELQKGLYELS